MQASTSVDLDPAMSCGCSSARRSGDAKHTARTFSATSFAGGPRKGGPLLPASGTTGCSNPQLDSSGAMAGAAPPACLSTSCSMRRGTVISLAGTSSDSAMTWWQGFRTMLAARGRGPRVGCTLPRRRQGSRGRVGAIGHGLRTNPAPLAIAWGGRGATPALSGTEPLDAPVRALPRALRSSPRGRSVHSGWVPAARGADVRSRVSFFYEQRGANNKPTGRRARSRPAQAVSRNGALDAI